MKTSRIVSMAISTVMFVTCGIPNLIPETSSASSAINVAEHTPQEIKKYIDSHQFDLYSSDTYKSTPKVTYPYEAGELSDESFQNALNTINCMRYIAGLPEVAINTSYNELAQAASLVNCANGDLSHYPVQPSDMPDDIYTLGKDGAASSNLSYFIMDGGSINCAYNMTLFLNDSDGYNISCLGHRRWCLNPAMSATGFGKTDCYFAMYAFDKKRTNATETGVCWPAQNMPIEYFTTADCYSYVPAWSISLGKTVSESSVEVLLTRTSDNKKWSFNSTAAAGDFYVNNSNYGQKGCIIFRPYDISYSEGDSFDVKITGAGDTIEYTVNFFSLDNVPVDTTEYALGDVNGDNTVDANDASDILSEYTLVSTGKSGIFNDNQRKSADVNGDNAVDANDASVVLAYYTDVSTGATTADIKNWLK